MSAIPLRRARAGEARAWLDHHLGCIGDLDSTQCVLWPFSVNGGSGGRYPQIRVAGQTVRVTRYLYEQVGGRPLAPGEVIRHSCDEPRCCNPWHLCGGSHAENMADMRLRDRQASGGRNGRARLTASDVREIRALARDHDLRGEIAFVARSYGVSPSNIALVLSGQTWTDVS